jgi:hypothetical protein
LRAEQAVVHDRRDAEHKHHRDKAGCKLCHRVNRARGERDEQGDDDEDGVRADQHGVGEQQRDWNQHRAGQRSALKPPPADDPDCGEERPGELRVLENDALPAEERRQQADREDDDGAPRTPDSA